MKEVKTLFAAASLILLTVLGMQIIVPSANAATGLVCIADASLNPASCPSSPASLSAPVGSSILVAVNIQGSDTLNGFDVAVQVDPSVLQPTNVTLTNSVIHDPRTVLAQSVDASTGVARAAVVAVGYSVTGPVTGNLLDVTYKVLVSGRGTDITFEAGCTGTSVPNTCVTVTSPGVLSETVQTASFAGTVTPDFTISANPPSQTLPAGASAMSAIMVASLNSFSGTINFTIPISCLVLGCPQWSINPISVMLISGGAAQAMLTFSTSTSTPPGSYSGTVTGKGGNLSHSVVVSFNVVPPPNADFSISANPASQFVQQGFTATSMTALTSLNGFSGTVNLSTSPPPLCPSCPGWGISPNSVMIPAGGIAQSTLTFTTTAASPTTTFNVNVTGTSGSLSHSVIVAFTIVPSPPPPVVGTVCIASEASTSCPSKPLMATGTMGGQLSIAVNVQNSQGLNGFDVQVLTDPGILRPVSDSLNGTILQNPNPLQILANSVNSTSGLVRVAAVSPGFMTTTPSTGRFFSITYNIVGATQGTFILFPAGCAGTSNDSICVTVTGPGVLPENILEANFTSTAPPPDFAISASPSSLTIIRGQSASSIITLNSLNGFTGTVTLSASITPSAKKSPSLSLTPQVTLIAGGTSTATLLVSTAPATPTGTYTISIIATSGSLTRLVTLTVTVLPKH